MTSNSDYTRRDSLEGVRRCHIDEGNSITGGESSHDKPGRIGEGRLIRELRERLLYTTKRAENTRRELD